MLMDDWYGILEVVSAAGLRWASNECAFVFLHLQLFRPGLRIPACLLSRLSAGWHTNKACFSSLSLLSWFFFISRIYFSFP